MESRKQQSQDTSKHTHRKKLNQLIEKLEALNLDVDFSSALHGWEFEHIHDFGDIWEALDDGHHLFVEVIYYHKAMEFLSEHDPSLNQSLALAHEFGCSHENLNSELLASLLASEMLREEVLMKSEDINEIINDLKA